MSAPDSHNSADDELSSFIGAAIGSPELSLPESLVVAGQLPYALCAARSQQPKSDDSRSGLQVSVQLT